jgi:two-component system, NarL family, invasion response regulator UvrY
MPSTNDIIRIGVADDDLSVCQLLSDYINTLDKCKVVIQSASGVELLKQLKKNIEIDLAILDISMPLMSGYETANYLRSHYPLTKIIFYSVSKNDLAIQLMVTHGGHGLIGKGKEKAEIKNAILAVMRGEYYFPFNGELVHISQNSEGRLLRKGISPEEITFLKYCATEMPYKEIAMKMKIEDRQLEHMRETLCKKMAVKTRTALVLKAVDCGIVSLPDPIPNTEIEEYFQLLKSV